ncbi:MAG: Lacal_2735 family protein [Aureibaculum sp.]
MKLLIMFGIFKKKSKTELLNNQYQKLLKEAHALSTTNRKASDSKYAEAEDVLNQIVKFEKS